MKKVLIANRGEIAVRVINTCRKMGISTVAIYSEADRDSRHVQMADEAFFVGPAPSADSYLQADKIIQICKENNVDGVHPGYGFLSENAKFVKSVTKAGIAFIGPSPEAIDLMGSKIDSKQAVAKYGVPLVPGINHAVEEISEATSVAAEIGYPVLVKASAGGGGKGMRMVEKPEDLESQMRTAQSEAQSAFGDRSVFIEKFVTKPRHIEIQLIADNYGNVVYLLERECSIQRRHQKLVEEAPSAVLTDALRKEMGEAAVNVAKACNYSGAGTVEFLLDAEHKFYFLEMNTRLQVEHPVTELITGLDLVAEQIKVTRGEKLSYTQEDIKANGHAIELRLTAEEPENGFVPAIGTIETYQPPQKDWVRLDDFVYEGYEIPIYYDNMFAKLIVWGEDRTQAIQRMIIACNQFKIEGVPTTLDFGRFVMQHPKFVDGDFDTNFIAQYYTPEARAEQDAEINKAAALFTYLEFNEHKEVTVAQNGTGAWRKRAQ
ncbi:acetyl-CoA carboxylase biotin carboxylase subunit [Bacteroidia bacterium]|nr:acetyl-CoA carboxylase biotin carboxylase subunit [Bacteroidia bacterium]MDB9883073.1 acetyl-CoA carboxylase biotin carboxylase subunit [Bacteroidia bacterium]